MEVKYPDIDPRRDYDAGQEWFEMVGSFAGALRYYYPDRAFSVSANRLNHQQ